MTPGIMNSHEIKRDFKGPAICNFSCNLQCNSSLGRCTGKIGKYKFPSKFADMFFICHKFTSLKRRIALQVARKIAPCDRAIEIGPL